MAIDCCKSYVGKQIIGLLPGGDSLPECLFYYSPNVDVTDWTVDGVTIYDPFNINAILNPFGYYYNQFYTSDNKESRLVLSYVGTEPPTYIPTILDSNGDPVIWNLTSCCDKVCLEGTYNAADYYYFNTGLGYNINVGDGANGFDDAATIEYVLKPLYGQQLTYSYTDNGDGTFYIKIEDAYICSPIAWSADDVTYTDMIPCAPPEAKCFYFMEINPEVVGGGSDLFNWTINGHNMWLPGFINTFMQGIGGNGNNINYTNGFSYQIEGAYLTYYGAPSTLPVFTILDQFGNDVSAYYSWTSYNVCTEQCFETTIEKEALYTYTISIDNTDTIQLLYSLTGIGPDLDWSNPVDVTIFESLLQSLYGPQVIVTSGLTVSGDYKVNIYNINTNQITINHGTGGAYVNVMNNIGC